MFFTERKATTPEDVPSMSSPGSHHSTAVIFPAFAKHSLLWVLRQIPTPAAGTKDLRLPKLAFVDDEDAFTSSTVADDEELVSGECIVAANVALAFFIVLPKVEIDAGTLAVHASSEKT